MNKFAFTWILIALAFVVKGQSLDYSLDSIYTYRHVEELGRLATNTVITERNVDGNATRIEVIANPLSDSSYLSNIEINEWEGDFLRSNLEYDCFQFVDTCIVKTEAEYIPFGDGSFRIFSYLDGSRFDESGDTLAPEFFRQTRSTVELDQNGLPVHETRFVAVEPDQWMINERLDHFIDPSFPRIDSILTFDANDQFVRKWIYEYFPSGQLQRITIIRSDGSVFSFREFSYNDDGLISSYTSISNGITQLNEFVYEDAYQLQTLVAITQAGDTFPTFEFEILYLDDEREFRDSTTFHAWENDLAAIVLNRTEKYYYSANTISVDDPQDHQYSIYPNPSTDHVLVQRGADDASVPEPYVLVDATGATVLKGALVGKHTRIDLSTLISGSYYLRVGDASVPRKIVVLRE